MKNKLDKIIIKNSDWTIKKVDFNCPEIQSELKNIRTKQQECLDRKKIDPATWFLTINKFE